jgi:hypothetical protein
MSTEQIRMAVVARLISSALVDAVVAGTPAVALMAGAASLHGVPWYPEATGHSLAAQQYAWRLWSWLAFAEIIGAAVMCAVVSVRLCGAPFASALARRILLCGSAGGAVTGVAVHITTVGPTYILAPPAEATLFVTLSRLVALYLGAGVPLFVAWLVGCQIHRTYFGLALMAGAVGASRFLALPAVWAVGVGLGSEGPGLVVLAVGVCTAVGGGLASAAASRWRPRGSHGHR